MREEAIWTRVRGGSHGESLDLLHARFRRRSYAPHLHEEFAIGASTGGVESIRYRGSTHLSGPGSILVLEPGEAHTGGPASAADGYAYRAFYPRAELLAEAAGDRAGAGSEYRPGARPHFAEPVLRDPALATELTLVHALLSEGGDALEAETRLLRCLVALVRRHAAAPAGPERGRERGTGRTASTAGALRSGLTGLVMERLADELTAPPTLARLAEETGHSRYQILRAFHRDLGMPPYAWLAQHRVQRARALLASGRSPADAAALTGFADQAHLTRWFTRVLGVTPGAYRNSVQDRGPRPAAPWAL